MANRAAAGKTSRPAFRRRPSGDPAAKGDFGVL